MQVFSIIISYIIAYNETREEEVHKKNLCSYIYFLAETVR